MTQGRTSSENDEKSVLWRGFEGLLFKEILFLRRKGIDPGQIDFWFAVVEKKMGHPKQSVAEGGLDWRVLPLKKNTTISQSPQKHRT